MNVVDNNGLVFMRKNKITSSPPLIITTDIRDEYEVEYGPQLPNHVSLVTAFNEDVYLRHYKETLNTYKSGRSFYNMRGFGDISILALLKTIREMSRDFLPSLVPETTVITSDARLIAYIKQEFAEHGNEFDSKISLHSPKKFFTEVARSS